MNANLNIIPKRMLVIENCNDCPCSEYEDGKGMGEPYYFCNRYNLLLFDWDGNHKRKYNLESFHFRQEIHPKCKLDKVE